MSLRLLMKRIKRIVKKYGIEVGGNIFHIDGKYRLGTLYKGSYNKILLPYNTLMVGQWHSHIDDDCEPSIGDFNSWATGIEIIANNEKIAIGIFTQTDYKRFKYEDYLCHFDIFTDEELDDPFFYNYL